MIDKSEAQAARDALDSLDRLVGCWQVWDPSGAGAIDGRIRFEWMSGRNFLFQHVDLGGAKGLEIIGYDRVSRSLRSHYYDESGLLLEYTYNIEGDRLTISIDMPGRQGQFRAAFAENGNSYAGRWQWLQDGKRMSYDAVMRRIC
ncbi:MAG TPA: hypothetical protein VM689_14675 [Aliidongia sp.]|nr:hypothetical protein [Aliidongia sp.]